MLFNAAPLKLMFYSIILIISFNFLSCAKHELKTESILIPKSDSTLNLNLTEKQKKILEGAKKCLEVKFNYDTEMAYHVLKYRDGEYKGSAIFPNGDLDPSLGVCTDVIIRALRWGGITDLQEEINMDIKSDWSSYPMKRWNAKNTDPNIDHRRVPNQMIWFSKYWNKIDDGSYQPGDIIAWDMDSDSWGDHIGIISDKFEEGIPYLIHNFPDPGYAAEEDVLTRWKIIGHYRIKE